LNEVEEESSPQPYPSEEREQQQNCDDKCSVIPENFEEKLEEKIENSKTEKQEKNIEPFVIDIPNNAVKQDLFDLKEFMQNEKS